ncbi:MAG TPA: glycosyltransferase, partial [Anaeromyxobacteraceae bacterium]|nr:glycosyltransferase [Anaeromyxobacteraceae bacterium]
ARDAERTVHGAAASILRQTERDMQLVAVDDGSRDGTAAVLERLAERDRRVVVVRGPGEGIAGALQRGLGYCDGEVVARMDADDVAHPRRLEQQRRALGEAPRLAAVGSRVRLFPRRVLRPGMRRYGAWLDGIVTPDDVARELLVEAPLVHPASAIRRSALDEVGGWRGGDFPEDYDLWLRISERGGLLANVPERLLDWRDSPDRLTRTDARYDLARHVALKCAFLRRTVLAHANEVAIWGAGDTGKSFADALARHRVGVALFVDVDRRKIGMRRRNAPVVSAEEAGRCRGLPLLVAVGAPGARPLIRAELARQGFEELRDYWVVS